MRALTTALKACVLLLPTRARAYFTVSVMSSINARATASVISRTSKLVTMRPA